MSNDGTIKQECTPICLQYWGDDVGAVRGTVPISLPRKAILFLAIAALDERDVVLRDTATQLLWEKGEHQRRNQSLKQLLFDLRRQIPEITVTVAGPRLVVDWGSVTCDIRNFRAAASEGDVLTCARLYRGGILGHFDLDGILDRWREDVNDRLRAVWEHCITEALGDLSREAEWSTIEEIATTALKIENPPISLIEAQLNALWALGRRHDLQQAIRKWRVSCTDDITHEELFDVLSRFEQLPHALPEQPAFIGRQDELKELWELLEQRGGRIVLISGPAGIGKSALAGQLLRSALVKRIPVLHAICDPRSRNVPFSTASLLLQKGADSKVDVSPTTRRLITAAMKEGLLSSLGEERTGFGHNVRALAVGLADLVNSISHDETCVLCIDDAQHADISSIHVLARMMEEVSVSPLVVFCSREERGSDPLELGSFFPTRIRAINLHPIPDNRCFDIVQSYQNKNSLNLTNEQRNDLVQLSAGNPLFLLELLERLRAGTPMSGAPGVPPTVRDNVRLRWGALNTNAKAFVGALACFQGRAEPNSVFHVSMLSEQAGFAAAEEAEQERFIRDEGSEYVIRHDLITEIVQESIGAARARAYHARIADIYGQSGESAAVQSWHLELAGKHNEAARSALRAAEFSSDMQAPSETIALLSRAAVLAQDPPIRTEAWVTLGRFYLRSQKYHEAVEAYENIEEDSPTAEVERKIAKICSMLAGPDSDSSVALAELQTAASTARQLDDTDGWINALAALALWSDLTRDRELLGCVAQELLEASARAGTEWLRVYALTLAGPALANLGNFEQGLRCVEAAASEMLAASWAPKVRVQSARAYINLLAGKPREAMEDLADAEATLRKYGAEHAIPNILSNLGLAKWQTGHLQEAEAFFEGGRREAGLHGRVLDGWACLINLALMYFYEGQADQAERIADTILEEGAMSKAEMAALVAWSIKGLCALVRADEDNAKRAESVLSDRRAILEPFPEPHPIVFLSRMQEADGCKPGATDILVSAISRHAPASLCRMELLVELISVDSAFAESVYGEELESICAELDERGLVFLRSKVSAALGHARLSGG